MRHLKHTLVLTGILFSSSAAFSSEHSRFTGDGEHYDFAIEGEKGTYSLYLADKKTNEPLTSVEVSIVPDDENVKSISFAATSQPGVYTFVSEESLPEGSLLVKGASEEEIEIYKDEHGSNAPSLEGHDHSHGGAKSAIPKVSGGLVFGFAGVFFIGLILGRVFGGGRTSNNVGVAEVHVAEAPGKGEQKNSGKIASGLALFLLAGAAALTNDAIAGEGHSHGEMSVQTRGGERETFVSKKSQFLLGLKTQQAARSLPEQSIQAIGHASVAPMFDATIKAPVSGEFRPARQMQLGTRVNKNEILGWVDGIGSVPVKSPIAGHIVSLDAFAGLRTESGAALLRVSNTQLLWIDADVFQQDLSKIRNARAVYASIDGRKIVGKVVTFQTNVSEQTLSGKVFVEVDNSDQSITVGSAGTVSFITGAADEEFFVLPRSAVLFRGAEAILYVQIGPESFEQKVVTFEPGSTPEQIVVKSGIETGDRVVVSGNYQLLTAAH